MKLSFRFILLFAFLLPAVSWAQPTNATGEPPHFVKVTSKASLIHLGSLDSFDITGGGTEAAAMVYEAVTKNDAALAKKAADLYEKIIPNENFGGEYTAMQWLCEYIAGSPEEKKTLMANPIAADWYAYLSQDGFEPLKDYLKKKYHLEEWKNKRTPKSEPKFRFLEDFILFNNPRRERWEKTSKIMEVLNIKKGDVIADIGCGPGYYTFKFSDLVGPSGYVYAVDINPQHIEHVNKLAKQLGVNNVETVLPKSEGLEIAKKADLAYLCSLYHNIYALDTDEERDKFMNGVKNSLKPDGTLVVVDNGIVQDSTMPYHGPHISKDLIINQLWYYGLKLVGSYQFIPQRYVLIFKKIPGPEPKEVHFAKALPDDCIPLTSKSSAIRSLKTGTSPGFTISGRKAARLFYTALEKKDPESVRTALNTYKELIPKERFGDEYLAFQWFCEYLLASPKEREKILEPWLVRVYFDHVASDDFKVLKTYLKYKYYFDSIIDDDDVKRAGPNAKRLQPQDAELPEDAPITLDQLNEWGDYIAFNSPYREKWEKTSRVLDFLKIKKGTRIADLGCGPGYYTFKFSDRVGPKGFVYAVDTLSSQTDYINQVCKDHNVKNIGTIVARDNDTKLPPDSVDLVYICSMYHAVYMISLEYVKDGFIGTLKRSMRKGARLVIADNMVLKDSENPYYGPTIRPEMIITQLKHYGFKLVDRTQYIPQRYVLVFELEK